MRHRNKIKILDRKKAARKALLRNLATSLILFEKIKTTEAKAKVLKPFIEKLVTRGKINNLNNRRQLKKSLYSENAVKKMLEELSPRYKDRKGGYLRIIKLHARQGDAAKLAQIEFV
jgi:large subunit ribosomal protein L17